MERVHRWLARYLRRHGWICVRPEPPYRGCSGVDTNVCWLALYQTGMTAGQPPEVRAKAWEWWMEDAAFWRTLLKTK